MLPSIRRIVTGHNDKGQAIVISDAPSANVLPFGQHAGLINLWATDPDPSYNTPDPMDGPVHGLLPPKGGTVFRFFQVGPEPKGRPDAEAYEGARRIFASMDGAETQVDTSRHPGMHKTETVDYIILLKGEVTLLLDADERRLKPFDVVIERGTNHAWVNHGDEPALLMAVLVDAKP